MNHDRYAYELKKRVLAATEFFICFGIWIINFSPVSSSEFENWHYGL